jgi:hypothetical protein
MAGAQPKKEANEIPRYGDINVLSALRTTFGEPNILPKRMTNGVI